MSTRMSDAPAPHIADTRSADEVPTAPRVRVLLTVVEGADLDAALAVIGRQVYEPAPEVVVVGSDGGSLSEGVLTATSLDEAIASARADISYLWMLHSDARPRPDALGALVAEMERSDAALAGSKLLVAGTENELESVGSATDVFGEPYTGLDSGEIDLQQYDVVREVAFVWSVSMLVRRDLAQGLRGLDPLLPPVAAGLDFSQRARLSGARVISVPSSEVYHQDRCEENRRGWREQAGRLRAILTAYNPLTLAWVVPFDLVVSMLDSLANILLLRWGPAADYIRSWGWNLFHLPSTIAQRRRLKRVRVTGDEELFRFQARGSVRLRETGSELTGRILSIFDDDQALVRGSKRVWASPGIWGAVAAAVFVIIGARAILFGGVPNVGLSFPFEAPTVALDRWFAGWNDSGLGSAAPVHPSVGLVGGVSWLWFGAQGAARTLMTVGFGMLAVVGMGRLAGRLGLRGPGRYLSGLVLVAGPGTALLAEAGSWAAIGAASVLPWAVRSAFSSSGKTSSRLSVFGWAILTGFPLAALSPLLAAVPLLVVVLWQALGGRGAKLIPATAALLGLVAALPFLAGDPGWITDADRRLGVVPDPLWLVLIVVATVPLVLGESGLSRLGTTGAFLALGAIAAARALPAGPGVEEALLVTGSFGTALIVAAGLDSLSVDWRRAIAALAAAGILVVSLGSAGNGRLGLPSGDVNDQLAFASTLADEGGPGRILIASESRSDIPGEARPGPGFWYRVVDGQGMTHDEVWLPRPLVGDRALDQAVTVLATGKELRPGELLAEYSIEWVVLVGAQFSLDDALAAQLDLIPTPLDPQSRVFENPHAVPIARSGSAEVWQRSGAAFEGTPGSDHVELAINYDDGWEPDSQQLSWSASVRATSGVAQFGGNPMNTGLALATIVLLAGSLVLIAVGRRRT